MLFMRDATGKLIRVVPGIPMSKGNQGGMGRRLDEAELLATLPDADIAGAIGLGVVPGGEQSVGARRAKLEADNAIIPPAPTYRPLGGAQQNNRGNAKIVDLPTTAVALTTQRIASVVETSKSGGDDAESITVQLGYDLPGQFQDPASQYATDVSIEVTCLLEWGVGNAYFSAEVDWAQGTSFSVTASFLRVSAVVSVSAGVVLPTLQMTLRASLGYGNTNSINTSSPARKTTNLWSVAGGSSLLLPGASSPVIAIPFWALGLTIVDAGIIDGSGIPNPGQPDYTIVLREKNTATDWSVVFRQIDRTNQANQVEGQFPIPGRTRFIQVTNNLGVAVNQPKVIFNLGF